MRKLLTIIILSTVLLGSLLFRALGIQVSAEFGSVLRMLGGHLANLALAFGVLLVGSAALLRLGKLRPGRVWGANPLAALVYGCCLILFGIGWHEFSQYDATIPILALLFFTAGVIVDRTGRRR